MSFSAKDLENLDDLVIVEIGGSEEKICFSSNVKSEESAKVFKYLKEKYSSIISDVQAKVPKLLNVVYNSTITHRSEGIEELF